MAQSFECLTLDFGSGHDITVCGFEFHLGLCTDSMEPTWVSLSPSLFSFSRKSTPAFSLKLNKKTLKKKKKKDNTKGLRKVE